MTDVQRRQAFVVAAVIVLGAFVAMRVAWGSPQEAGRAGAAAGPRTATTARATVLGAGTSSTGAPASTAAPATTTTPVPSDTVTAPSAKTTAPPARGAVPSDPRPVLDAAGTFMAAMLRWESGHHAAITRTTVRRLSVARVARLVLGGSARATPGGFRPREGEVRHVDLADEQPHRDRVVVLAEVARGEEVSSERLVLGRHGGGWRVTRLG